MNKVNFDFLDAEGFRSLVLPFHFYLNKPGLNLIKGINGVGKTSAFEALIWDLYGINLKDTNQDQVVTWLENRTSQFQGTRVATTFHILRNTYCVIRHINFKGLTAGVKGEDYLMLLKDGVMVGDYRNKKEMQEAINQLLGVDARTFLNSILFGQRMQKLIQQDNKDKRELFETLFETEWVGNAKTKCDADIAQWNSELLKLGWDINKSLTEIEHLTDKLLTAKETLAGFEEARANRILNKQVEQGQYTDKLVGFEKELVTYTEQFSAVAYDAEAHQKLNDQYDALEKQINEAKLAQKDYDNKISRAESLITLQKSNNNILQAELNKLQAKHIADNCPYCEQALLPGNKLEVNHNKDLTAAFIKVKEASIALKEAEKALKALQKIKAPATPESLLEDLNALGGPLVEFDSQLEEYNKLNQFIKDTNTDITQAKKDLCRVINEIEGIKVEKPPMIDIEVIEINIEVEQNKLEGLQHHKPEIEHKIAIAEWWSKKALASGGVKAFVFKSMLTQLNQCVKKYGDRLGASLEFSIDLTKASKPFTTNCSLGDKLNKDYRDFSGGEKDRLDICLMFGLYDVISMNSDMNLLIMDEPFSGLDEEGETIVFELMREKTESGKSVYVITHSPTLDSLYANKIEFTKINGNTLILN